MWQMESGRARQDDRDALGCAVAKDRGFCQTSRTAADCEDIHVTMPPFLRAAAPSARSIASLASSAVLFARKVATSLILNLVLNVKACHACLNVLLDRFGHHERT